MWCVAFNKKKQKNQAGRLARFARVAREHHHGAREPAEEGRPRSARAALVHGGGDGGGGGGSRFPLSMAIESGFGVARAAARLRPPGA